jgi:hypothetical protein
MACLVGPSSATAQPPSGGQFQINTYTTGFQLLPSLAMQADGDFVVVWESSASPGTDTSDLSVQARRHASDGSALGAEFQVNTYTTSRQYAARIADLGQGDFVVVWQSYGGAPGTDTSFFGVQGQRFASDGSPRGAQFQVNSYTTNSQGAPSVAALQQADFVVVWESYGSLGTDTYFSSVQGQRFASDGSPRGSQFQINTYTTSDQSTPSVSADGAGNFTVVWTSRGSSGTDTSYDSIQGQRYASNGSALGAEFQVNTYTSLYQRHPAVAADSAGGFVVVWESRRSSGTDSSLHSIQGQRYASDGSMRGVQFQVNTFTTADQTSPSVAAAADGDFVVTWDNMGSISPQLNDVSGQRYASDGSMRGGEFQVNSYTSGAQGGSAVALDSEENFVVVWHSSGSSGTDTSSTSIQGQRYAFPDPPAVPALSANLKLALGGALALLGAVRVLRTRQPTRPARRQRGAYPR